MGTKRAKCRICGKSLSIYNRTKECFYHNEDPDSWPWRNKITFGGMCGNNAWTTQLREEGRI